MAAVSMNESGSNFADETMEMVSEGVNNASAELRKRRSTRIVQAVPLVVTGVDALGRPVVERTTSFIINCPGCPYQSKKYVPKKNRAAATHGSRACSLDSTASHSAPTFSGSAGAGSFRQRLGHRVSTGRLECVLRHGAGCDQVGCGTRDSAVATSGV